MKPMRMVLYAFWIAAFAWVGAYLHAISSYEQEISIPHVVAWALLGLVVGRFFHLARK